MAPSIYHIVHLDNLESIFNDRFIYSYKHMIQREGSWVDIGMNHIKERRLYQRRLTSHPGLYVGECVPFYFCPRSIMLYVIHKKRSPHLDFKGGQENIIHLVSSMREADAWAKYHNQRTAFTDNNAGSSCFNDYSDLGDLNRLNWDAIYHKGYWGDNETIKSAKQSEFLIEDKFPLELITGIGVYSEKQGRAVAKLISEFGFGFNNIQLRRDWYY